MAAGSTRRAGGIVRAEEGRVRALSWGGIQEDALENRVPTGSPHAVITIEAGWFTAEISAAAGALALGSAAWYVRKRRTRRTI
jgi:hypothetical protein